MMDKMLTTIIAIGFGCAIGAALQALHALSLK